MKKVLVLGAGLVAKPLVNYFLKKEGIKVEVADSVFEKAKSLVEGFSNGKATQFLVEDTDKLKKMVKGADVIVSLLPATLHVKVAKICIELKKNMVTTSYVSPQMQSLEEDVKKAQIIILNECGLDPGIDHMTAMKIINQVKAKEGIIISFTSYCGGLPAPEANNNPFGYKFSWSPKGAVLAAKNPALYLKDGKEINIKGEELFKNYFIVKIEGLGDFEIYPNRDSLSYIKKYDIPDVKTMFRGTLRNLGHCDTWFNFVKLGLLDDIKKYNLKGYTYKKFLLELINEKNLTEIYNNSDFMSKLEWLGFLSDNEIPFEEITPIDLLVSLLIEKLQYKEGERDMVVLYHEIIANYPKEKKKEKIISTFVDYGIPYSDTSMSRTVGLPAALGANLILEGKINLTGIYIPVVPEIYEPILNELQNLGINYSEKKELID